MHANETTGGGGAAQLHESSRAAEAACTSEGRPDHSVHSQCLQMADPSSKLRNISSTVANGTRLKEKRKKKEKFFSFSNNVHSVHSQGLQMADPSFFQDLFFSICFFDRSLEGSHEGFLGPSFFQEFFFFKIFFYRSLEGSREGFLGPSFFQDFLSRFFVF